MGRRIEVQSPVTTVGRWYDLFLGRPGVKPGPGMWPHNPPDQENPSDEFDRIVDNGGGEAELSAAFEARLARARERQ